MKIQFLLLTSFILTGCSSYGWVAPIGKKTEQISLEHQYCQDSANFKYPKKLITEMVEPSKIIPAHQNCERIKKQEPYNCKKINQKITCDVREVIDRDCVFVETKFVEARYKTVDINEKERNADVNFCLQSKGYKWEKIN